MGGRQVDTTGSGDDGFDEDGYDESQRAEIMEFERDGPGNGVIQTDLDPDLGENEDLLGTEDEDLLGTEDGLGVLGDQDGDGNTGRRPDGDEEADLDEDGIEDEDDDDAEPAADEVEIRQG